jgi:hypothetical protein
MTFQFQLDTSCTTWLITVALNGKSVKDGQLTVVHSIARKMVRPTFCFRFLHLWQARETRDLLVGLAGLAVGDKRSSSGLEAAGEESIIKV